MGRLWRRAALAAGLALLPAMPARASSLQFCDRQAEPTVVERDTLLRFAAVVRDQLDAAGSAVAIVARSGTDLRRFGARYSHSGVALRAGDGRGWSVRQLYYACDERRARLFDQGLAGFLFGTDNVRLGWLSVVLLPDEAATSLAGAALDNDRALGVLGARYSANAYPFSVRYQNCNQWVMELLAQALGGLDATAPDARARAQAWLQAQGYEPAVFEVPWHPLEWVVGLMSLLHNDDHPPADLAANRYRVSMPTAIEDFVRARVPGARRLALCHADARVVIHEGWDEIAEGCLPGPGDRVLDLDAP